MSDALLPQRSLRRPLILGAAIAVAVVAAGLALRAQQAHAVVEWTERQAVPAVQVVTAGAHGDAGSMTLPGHLTAWTEAPIHARVGGYLKSWSADIGQTVKAGEVLAVIDSPELDQQIAQAHAHLLQVQADAALAKVSAERWQGMLGSHSVSRQEADEKQANAVAAQASVEAAQADYARLQELGRYRTLRAPFAGTVTSRQTDVGQLIRADDSGRELFNIADTRRLRLMVPVPQGSAGSIQPGLQASLQVPGQAGRHFTATLQGDSSAIDRSSGTLLAQFVVDNADGALLPGSYAEVTLPQKGSGDGVSVPADVLIFRAKGTQVAVVDEKGIVHLRDIHIASDLGSTLRVDRGLKAGDRVIPNPPDALREGDQVRVVAGEQEPAHARG
ncbi:efflux RND transporter periplasmic adaptor subunit [Stenotrophomonas sp. ESTM1D_MKCIP4_1]|uniref:efflux RND transporter periplasmic adaptor subunit n=1 Tax=Stenotrophomonas sp. ESTM1D_MKCIP4_1 TaxID=2072414 RepID=UPI000D53D386|nr:efflux RND transporter periplasmic adaptor subunit [Stenotrophomonas sp. ESTM1D_MKCIP4_1]AWH53802.1 efflux RND transporter periplasmic adaptor subunit [Stenotrophomonas sp. ESTM1D_MKCIP4_1]